MNRGDSDPLAFLRGWIGCSASDELDLRQALSGRVLDVGAGPGSRIDPSSKIGLDQVEPEMAVAVDRSFAGRPGASHAVIADVDGRSLPFADGSFDVSVCMHVLEHVAKPRFLVQELARVVKPRGWIFIAIPNGWSLSDNLYKAWKSVFLIFKGEAIPHVQRFTKSAMLKLLTDNPCDVRYVARMGESWEWLSKHPRMRGALASLTRSASSDFLSYGWLFVARRR
jgi:SAM-dependent methyltransferase